MLVRIELEDNDILKDYRADLDTFNVPHDIMFEITATALQLSVESGDDMMGDRGFFQSTMVDFCLEQIVLGGYMKNQRPDEVEVVDGVAYTVSSEVGLSYALAEIVEQIYIQLYPTFKRLLSGNPRRKIVFLKEQNDTLIMRVLDSPSEPRTTIGPIESYI
ncbi:MAG: hypothetical protein CL678_16060 [Bdellovibrionaceae bacterium]|nr:hypothetical protein [Pseudobdellovibrionaceae bacterium]|tara:strand:- start:2601 stop:3083 length:483 start_codon:yes stop_codon:yes gene_type:complete